MRAAHCGTLGVNQLTRAVITIPVLAPLVDIAAHVIELQLIRQAR